MLFDASAQRLALAKESVEIACRRLGVDKTLESCGELSGSSAVSIYDKGRRLAYKTQPIHPVTPAIISCLGDAVSGVGSFGTLAYNTLGS